jgi:sugar phosphate isomerase/epimerase
MIKTLHGLATYYSNVLTQARIAKETGYDAVEFISDTLLRYLDNGGTTAALKAVMDDYGLKTACINALKGIERHGEDQATMLEEAERLSKAASELECENIQIMALTGIDDKSESEIMDILTDNVSRIAEIGEKYGVRYQIEIVAFTKFSTLKQALQLIERIGKPNVGIVVDFWHLYARGTTPEDIANLNKDIIFGVHFCDGRKPKPGEDWDEAAMRSYFPGTGEIDVKAYADAVKQTGFDGVWSAELFHPEYWEGDQFEVAKLVLDNMMGYVE